MGTYGYKITHDDLVQDIISEYTDYLKKGNTFDQANVYIKSNYSHVIEDEEEGCLVFIALAKVQWDYTVLDELVLNRVVTDYDNRIGFTRWKEAGDSIYNLRVNEISKFISQLKSINPKPKKIPRIVARKPLYCKGDCLTIKLEDGYYGAWLVLDEDHSDIEHGQSLVILMDYHSINKPSVKDFKKVKFLRNSYEDKAISPKFFERQGRSDHKYHIFWIQRIGYKNIIDKVEVFCNIDVKKHKKLISMTVGRADNLINEANRIWISDK